MIACIEEEIEHQEAIEDEVSRNGEDEFWVYLERTTYTV